MEERRVLRAGARHARALGGGAAPLSRQRRPAAGQGRHVQGSGGARSARWPRAAPRSSTEGPIAQRDRARRPGGGRLARRGRPRGVRAGVARAARRSPYRGDAGPHGAAAVLAVSDARDAQHPRRATTSRAWGHNSAEYLHHLIEAIKLASADRLAYAYSPGRADPRPRCRRRTPRAQRARIDAARAAVSEGERLQPRAASPDQIGEGHPAKFANEHTTHFACADADGTVVSVTQTLGVPFGSGFAVPGTGRRAEQRPQVDGPRSGLAERASGRAARPCTMMSPTQVFRDGALRAVDRHAGLVRHPPDHGRRCC